MNDRLKSLLDYVLGVTRSHFMLNYEPEGS